MSASSAGIGLKFKKQMGPRAMGAWDAWVTGAFIFQTNSSRGSTHLSAFSLTCAPTILAVVHENCWDKKFLVKVASLESTFPSSSTQSGPPESPWQVSSPPMMKPFSAAKSFSLLPLFSTLADLRDNCECELAGALHLTWTSVGQVPSFPYSLEPQMLKTGIWCRTDK